MRFICFSLALLLLAACGDENTSERHIALAQGFIAELDFPAARIELQNALRLDGNSAEARWLLGKIYLEAGEILAAENELQRSGKLGWPANDIRPALAETLLVQGKFAEVLALDPVELEASAAAQLLSIQALAALAEGHADRASELAALALSRDPQRVEAKLAQATIAIHRGDPGAALGIVDAVLVVAPDDGNAWGVKGQALLALQRLEDARAAFDQAIAHSNVALAERVGRAMINLQLKDYDAAQADATELLRLSPRNPAGNYLQGLLYYHDKSYRDAISALTLAKSATSQFPQVLYYLSLSYLLEGDGDLAEKFASQFVRQMPDDRSGRQLLGSLLVLHDKVDEARELLQPVLDQNPDDVVALNIMANAQLLDGQADKGLLAYARIAKLYPRWPIIPLHLEVGLVTGNLSDTSGQYTEPGADEKANFPQDDILLILGLLQKKDFPGAIEAAKSYQFRDLDSVAPYRVLGMVYLAAGRTAQARKALEKALKRDPGDPASNQALAQMALDAGKVPSAREYYQTVLDNHPDDLITLLQLAALEAREKNSKAMVARLEQAMLAHPTALEPRLKMAGYYMGSDKPEKVASMFATLSTLQKQSPAVIELTALSQLALHENESAAANLQRLVDAQPDSVRYHYMLAIAASETGDQSKAKEELAAALALDSKHVPTLINLARIANNEGEGELFEQYLATLLELAPQAPEVLRLQSKAELAKGNLARALAITQTAFSAAPDSQTLIELTVLQKAAGQHTLARGALQMWIKAHPEDVKVRLILANDLQLEDNLAGAQAQYFAALALEPDNLLTLNNLAWNLRRENPKQALEYIRRAVQIAPDQPDLLDTLAVIESLNGHHKAAQRAMKRALAASPDDPAMRYHQAMITAVQGNTVQAILALDELLATESGDFPERAEAEFLLEQLRVSRPVKAL
jgi:putative PEP-CTERM system TPR-repeat lipoprotein